MWTLATPTPDLLITGDGKHLAVKSPDGTLRLLRPRAGDYVRDLLGWGTGIQATALDLDAMPGAKCSDDACVATLYRGGRDWHLLATRSKEKLDWAPLTRACGWADIIVSDRRLPKSCTGRWLRLDATALGQSGGMAIALAGPRVESVNGDDHHPWVMRAPPFDPKRRRLSGRFHAREPRSS